jgi:hypothetical protein
MGAVAEVVSDVVDPVVQVVGQVEDAVVNAAEQVGKAVEQVGQQVGKTVEAMAKDPAKALPLIAVAVVAPELAPLLWEGATAAEAAMVLNTGMQLAQGADPIQVAENLATSAATMGVTQGLDISTGFNPADRVIGSAASAALQGQDINKAIGSSIGNQLIGNVVSGGVSAGKEAFASDNTSQDNAPAQSYSDLSKEMTTLAPDTQSAALPNDAISTSQTFRDAISNGFSPQEAYAIAQGQNDAATSGPSPYAPTASTTTSDQPNANVTVTGAPDTGAAATNLPQQTKEELDRELADGKLTQEEYDRALPNASTVSKSEQDYIDPQGALSQVGDTSAPSKEPSPTDGVVDANKTGDNIKYTYDDGSTLTVSATGEVVDVTEATDTGAMPDNYQETPDEKSGSGFALTLGSGAKQSNAAVARSRLTKGSGSGTSGSSTSSAPVTSGSSPGLSFLGDTQTGTSLTQGSSSGNPNYSLLGEVEQPDENMATGGYVQHMAAGSTPTTTSGVYDLSSSVSSPFLGGGGDIMKLNPGVIKGKTNYALPGYPFGQEWKLASVGGAIENAPEGHNPEFFSEGGLNSMQHTYLKGGGDGTSDSIPAMLANGEFVIPADVVSSLGNGSSDSGAKVLDEFLKTIRAHKRKADPKKLPPDSKGPMGYLKDAKKKVKK